MHLVYIDDSKDERNICFSAIIVPAADWMNCLDHLIGMRRAMRSSDGIYMKKELHATDWLGGRGNIAPDPIPKGARARLFQFVLSAIVRMPSVQIINAHSAKCNEMQLFERLLNRINRFASKADSHAIIFSDEGKNYDSLLRRLRRHNPVPSAYGLWQAGVSAKNIPVEHILEDIVYRDSANNYFIQAADFCAFALLRYENPTEAIKKHGLERAFETLTNVMVRQAYSKDPKKLGIIRV